MNFDRITLVTAPTTPALDMERVKQHLKVSHDDDDDLIGLYLDAATAFVEGPHGIGVALRPATYRMTVDGFPCGSLAIPLRPVTGVSAITYKDSTGAVQTLAPAAYVVDLDTATITPAIGDSWPSTASLPGSVTVTFVAGLVTIPSDLQAAILLIVGNHYENREGMYGTSGTVTPVMNPTVEAILSRYRVTTFG
jgi:uncharacterized phiE125 gp8 family phage protein